MYFLRFGVFFTLPGFFFVLPLFLKKVVFFHSTLKLLFDICGYKQIFGTGFLKIRVRYFFAVG